jgi:glycosyltransferase involved in cell wall biosynthesis
LLKDFYTTSQEKWSKREQLIFKITKWVLHNVDALVFSTSWQKDIWMKPYDLAVVKMEIIENYYGEKEESFEPTRKNFIAGTRKLKWKNLDILKKAFEDMPEVSLDLDNYPREEFLKKISECYATILTSLGDISPNMILESIRYNKPFILTNENGLMDRISQIAVIVDPKNLENIKEKILWLCKKGNYDMQVEKIKNFTFTHTWQEIAEEVLDLYKKL